MTLYAGIDIGLSGAVSFLDETPGSIPWGYRPLPLTSSGKRQEVDAAALYCILTESGLRLIDLTVVVEECPHQTKSKAAMRSMALSFGKVLGMLEAKGIKTILCPAPRWQKALFGAIPKGTTKQAALGLAKRLWPTESFIREGCRVPSEGIIDASLIAEYARRNSL